MRTCSEGPKAHSTSDQANVLCEVTMLVGKSGGAPRFRGMSLSLVLGESDCGNDSLPLTTRCRELLNSVSRHLLESETL